MCVYLYTVHLKTRGHIVFYNQEVAMDILYLYYRQHVSRHTEMT